MAALCRAFSRTLRPQSLLVKCMKSPCNQTWEANTGVCGVVFTRGKKGQGRFKLPPTYAEKGQYVHKKSQKSEALAEEDPDVKYEGRVPEDDVWIRKYYPTPRYTLLDAVTMHREAAVPEMFDNEDGILVLNCALDLRTKKKTKFMKEFIHTVVLPHYFNDGTVHRLMVFCKTDEDKTTASELGAEFVGGLELVKSVLKGEIKHDDYDHCICTADMYQEINSLRKHLRERFPSPKAGTVGGDVATMFRFFTEGKTYESERVEEKVGKAELHFATLNMTDEQIQENFDAVIEDICSLKSAALGQFITKCTLECPPSREEFMIDESELLPKSQRDKKVKKVVQDEAPEIPKQEDEADSVEAEAVAK